MSISGGGIGIHFRKEGFYYEDGEEEVQVGMVRVVGVGFGDDVRLRRGRG
jgi:hypothetical protein